MLGSVMADASRASAGASVPAVAVLYTDLDGTLLGPGGSLLHGPDGRPDLRAASALAQAAEAGLLVVPVSGRGATQLRPITRVLGLSDCIAEAGAVVVRGGRTTLEWGRCPADLAETPHEALQVSGALQVALETVPGALHPYEPWCHGRLGGHLLRGLVDVATVNQALADAGLGWAYLVDNGQAGASNGHDAHAYHLLPRGVSKGAAVADDLRARGLVPAQAAAVGDSAEDRTMAAVVGTYFEVANARTEPSAQVRRLDLPMGHGFAAAVAEVL